MTKRPVKLLPVWIAISAVLLIAGIVLYVLMGFNTSAERTNYKSVEIGYDVVTDISEDGVGTLKEKSEAVFKENKLTVSKFEEVKEVDSNTGSETGNAKFVYYFAPSVSDETLKTVNEALVSMIQSAQTEGLLPSNADIGVSVHASEMKQFHEAAWRGAVGIAVGVIVVLVYVGFRFGIGAALTGLTACVHDVFVTLAIFAITRIPTYTFAPLLFAALAAVVSVVLWLVQCMKMRDNFKDPSYAALSAEDAVEQSLKTSWKYVVGIAATLAVVLVVFGGIATAGVRVFFLPALVPVAVATYSALLFAPALHVPVKAAFDKIKAKRKARYVGKAKTEKNGEN